MPRSYLAKPFRFRIDGTRRVRRAELGTMITQAMHQLALTIPDEYAHLRGYYSDIENAATDSLEFVAPGG